MMAKIVLVQKAVSKVFGDFVSKVVSDGVDALKDAIKNADLDRKSYNQNLQTRLYQLIVDALNRFTYNKYGKQDKLYDAVECIIKGYIGNKDNTDAVKSGLKMLVSGVNDDICQEFLEILCGEICRDDNNDLYKEFDMLWKKQESEHFRGEFAKVDQNDREILEQLNDLKEVLEFIKRNMSRQEDKSGHNRIPIVNRADEYAKKWNENVFLNNFNEEDESAGINIKLREIYVKECLPHYIWKTNSQSKDTLRNLLMKYIVNIKDKKMLLILGQPGIGKSTLITWIVANLVEKKENILVYQFATDLNNIDWQSKNVLDDIFSTIGLEYDKLENKTLLLDGFDEIYVGGDREKILNKLLQELKRLNILKSFSLIITCRENYIPNQHNLKCDYIVLQAWEETQIETFCRAYWGRCKRAILESKIQKIQENKEIFGIPLILYMILALDIAIEKNSSIVDIYDQIFSAENGIIYDRCYDSEHRINLPKIKVHIYRISQKMAFWIFENNADKAFVSQEKFEEICDNEMNEYGENGEYIQSETLIGNFFKLKYSEGKGTNELQFVHRSIYEYFVAEYFYESINKLASKEDIAGKLGELLKDGRLSEQILEFIKYKFDNIEEYSISEITKEVFNIMLRDGMTYHVGTSYKNLIEREMNIFINMLEIMSLWNSVLEDFNCRLVVYLKCNRENYLKLRKINLGVLDNETQYILNEKLRKIDLKAEDLEKMKAFLVTAKSMSKYFRDVKFEETYLQMADYIKTYFNIGDLMGIYLREADLRGANLRGVDLQRANLQGADLREANLVAADLSSANLKGADLREANLVVANLTGVKLIGADLTGANLSGTDIVGADLRGASLSETNLRGANLYRANLGRANLCGADLREASLNEIYFFEPCFNEVLLDEKQMDFLLEKYDLEGSKVYIFETEEIISYEEYCCRRQKK